MVSSLAQSSSMHLVSLGWTQDMAMSKAGCPIPPGSDVVPGIQIKGDELPHTVRWRDLLRVVMQSIRVVHRLPRGPWENWHPDRGQRLPGIWGSGGTKAGRGIYCR